MARVTLKSLKLENQTLEKKVTDLRTIIREKKLMIDKYKEETSQLNKKNNELSMKLQDKEIELNYLKDMLGREILEKTQMNSVQTLKESSMKNSYEQKLSDAKNEVDQCKLRNHDVTMARDKADQLNVEYVREINNLKEKLTTLVNLREQDDIAIKELKKKLNDSQRLQVKDLRRYKDEREFCRRNHKQ